MASTMGDSVTTNTITASYGFTGFASEATIAASSAGTTYRLTDHGVGKIVFTKVNYSASGTTGCPIYTPNSGSQYLVFAESKTTFYPDTKNSTAGRIFLFNVVNANTKILTANTTINLIHIRIS